MEGGRERNYSLLLASATADEILVAEILLQLGRMMSLSESLSSSNWGRRRRRSCLASPSLATTSSSPDNRIAEKKLAVNGGSSPSPETPFAFPPSEADEKNPSGKSFKKGAKQREELLDMIDEQIKRKVLLTGEIEKVKKHLDQLKAYNSLLKAKKQEMLNSEKCRNYFFPIGAKSQPSEDGVGAGAPLWFDLNLPAEEEPEVYRPLDVTGAMADRRARFAEARRNRIGIMKTKSNRFKHY